MEKIKISIIIPVYNVEKYLKECLDSILAQTFQDYEIICVDDGSTDRTLDILQEYKRKDDDLLFFNNAMPELEQLEITV